MVTVVGNKKNNISRVGNRSECREHDKYCEYHKSTRHDTIECTILERELEKKMQVGQLNDLIRGLLSKKLESIAPTEPKINSSGKNDIFMFRQQERPEADQEWDGYRFTFDEWDYINNNQKGDEHVIIGGFIGKKYVIDI